MAPSGSVTFIYASIIAPVPDLIADHGGRIERPFREAGIPVQLASEPEQLVPVRDYLALLEACARETGDDHFGVSLAERLRIDDLGPLGRLISGAPTLRWAISTANALIRNYSPILRPRLEIGSKTARWRYEITGIRHCTEGRRLEGEHALVRLRNVIRLAAGPNWQPHGFLLKQATPLQRHALESRLRAPAGCDGTGYALVFSRDLLDLPMTYARPLTIAERQTLLAHLLSSRPEDSFADSVKAIVRGRLCGGYPKITAVARATGLSVRTLQRRLADEEMSYADLVAEVRRDLARKLLAEPSKSHIEIAMSLGYSDAASFSRAFRHWTGASPRQFRRLLQHSPSAA